MLEGINHMLSMTLLSQQQRGPHLCEQSCGFHILVLQLLEFFLLTFFLLLLVYFESFPPMPIKECKQIGTRWRHKIGNYIEKIQTRKKSKIEQQRTAYNAKPPRIYEYHPIFQWSITQMKGDIAINVEGEEKQARKPQT